MSKPLAITITTKPTAKAGTVAVACLA